MATGLQRIVRRALLAKLKGSATLTALVPAASINPDGEPTWPHVKLRAPVTRRLRGAGLNGGEGSFDIHAFARSRYDAGARVETAEDHAGRIGAAIETALADNRLALDGGGTVRIEVNDMRLLEDDTPDAFHWFAQVNWRALAS